MWPAALPGFDTLALARSLLNPLRNFDTLALATQPTKK